MHDRIEKLVARFTDIGEQQIKDLPIYNADLTVEAVGFEHVEEHDFLGVLITPWFLNLLLLPCDFKMWRPNQIGHEKIERQLPSDVHIFTLSGDEIIGEYYSISLISPMFCFFNQEQARATALEHLQHFLTPPAKENTEEMNQPDPQRRRLLRGFLGRGNA